MNYFVIFTILSVSIDSMVCGFYLAFIKGNKILVPLIVAFTVFIMCLFANYLSLVFSSLLNERIASLSGAILMIIGFINLIKKPQPINNNTPLIRQSIVTAFAVGMDGAFANLSLAILGYNNFIVPLSIAITHAIMVVIGISLYKTKFVQKFKAFSFLPSLILIALGGYKLLGFFI